jgi:hypothetical protein
MNKICETPLQSATDMLKHMAQHSASRAFIRPEVQTFAAVELPPLNGVPMDRIEPAMISLNERPMFIPAEIS